MSDFVTRLCQLAGTDVAQQVVSEFGGRAVYIKRTVDDRGTVKCESCANPVDKRDHGAHCPKIGLHVSLNHRRVCRFHRPITT